LNNILIHAVHYDDTKPRRIANCKEITRISAQNGYKEMYNNFVEGFNSSRHIRTINDTEGTGDRNT